jgi:hypothetical protein
MDDFCFLNHFMDDHHWLIHPMDDHHWLIHPMDDLTSATSQNLRKKKTQEEIE